MSDNTTTMIDNSTDNSCVASDNSNSSNVNSCKNVNSVTIGNASSSYGNNSSIISNIACNTIPDDNVPTNVNDKMDVSNVNDNMGNLNNDNIVPLPETMLLQWRTLPVIPGPGVMVRFLLVLTFLQFLMCGSRLCLPVILLLALFPIIALLLCLFMFQKFGSSIYLF